MHRTTAKTYTKRAQVACGVLVAAASVPFFVKAQAPEPVELKVPEPVVNDDAAIKQMQRRQVAEASPTNGSRIDSVAPPVAKVEPPTGHPKPPEPVKYVPPPLKYIGAIMTGSFKRAIVVQTDMSQKEQQRMLAEGDKIDNDTVVEIKAETITIRDKTGADKTIELSARQLRPLRIVGPGGQPGQPGPIATPQFQPVGAAAPDVIQAMENKVAELEKSGDAESAAKMRGELDRVRGGGNEKGGRPSKGGEGGKGGK